MVNTAVFKKWNR